MIVKPVLMHDPIRLLAMGGAAFVEDEGLSHADPFEAGVDDLITAGGFPETSGGGAVGPGAGGILLVLVTKEIPVILRGGAYSALLCRQVLGSQ